MRLSLCVFLFGSVFDNPKCSTATNITNTNTITTITTSSTVYTKKCEGVLASGTMRNTTTTNNNITSPPTSVTFKNTTILIMQLIQL